MADSLTTYLNSGSFWENTFFQFLDILILAPIVSLFVGLRQQRRERLERERMIPHILGAFEPLVGIVQGITRGPDGDYLRGGLTMFKRAVANADVEPVDENKLHFYLGHPVVVSEGLHERVVRHVKRIDALLDIFAPHFRTGDAVNAQNVRQLLSDFEHEAGEVAESIEIRRQSTASICTFLGRLGERPRAPEAGQEDMLAEVAGNVGQQIDRDIARFDGLFDRLVATCGQVIVLVEGLSDNRRSYADFLAKPSSDAVPGDAETPPQAGEKAG